MNRRQVILDLKDLRTRFHIAEGTVYAVNGVSLTLHECETIAIVGESGCGKSVTMLSVMGLIPVPPGEIVSGQAFYRGRDLLAMSEAEMEHIRGKELAMVFQDPMTALNPVLTIGRQISEPLRVHLNMDHAAAQQRVLELLEQVGIPDPKNRMNDYPHQFSGGMRQRAMLAMALACAPSVLIADEPTTALDVTIQAQIIELVTRLRDALCMAVIWITHDLGIIAGLAQRVAVMYGGYIIEEAPVKELYKNPQHPYTIGLLGSLPRLDYKERQRLTSIDGLPPVLYEKPNYCPFAPRCKYAIDRCWNENPALEKVDNGHFLACWVNTETGSAR